MQETFIRYVSTQRLKHAVAGTDANVPTYDNIKKVATGDVYLGRQALNFGLVDYLGSLDTAIETVEKIGNFKHSNIYTIEKKAGLFYRLGWGMGASIGESIADKVLDSLQNKTNVF